MIKLSDFRHAQTPVRDQGNRGSCVGFAVSAAHEWMRPGTVRSVEDILWAAHKIGGDPKEEGTTVQFAFQGAEKHRHASEPSWPYGMPPFPAERPHDALQSVNQADLTGWHQMAKVDLTSVADEIADGNAVVLTLRVVLGAWPKDGLIDAPPGRKAPANHAVLAVGTTNTGGQARTVIKNSWGSGWGVNGFGFVSQRYVEYYATNGHVLEPAA